METEMASAVERIRQNTFEVRDKSSKRPRVAAGLLVKVGIRGERFWCKVQRVRDDGALVAIVDNELLRSPWKCGDEIIVQQSHVLETSDPADATLAGLLAVLGSVSEAAMLWRELRLRDGSGAGVKSGTRVRFVLPDVN